MTATTFLTPSVRGLLDQIASAPPPDPSPAGQRAALEVAMAALGWPAATAAEVIALDSGASIHLFRPAAHRSGLLPVIVYLHGGGFVAGSATSHGGVAQALADRASAVVALVDYRLVPEHPLPAAIDDSRAAIDMVFRSAFLRGLDPARVSLLGDCAGGWLALHAVRRNPPGRITRLVLVNPMIDPSPAPGGSRKDYAEGFFARTEDFDLAWRLAGTPAPFAVDLSTLPSTIVITNDSDPVRDEGEAFAEAASAAGAKVLALRTRGLIHAAWLFPNVIPEADLLLDLVASSAVPASAPTSPP